MADFADIIGQKQMIDHLQNALRTGKASHAYIITGEKESGKEFIARIFAKTLMCSDRHEDYGLIEPCHKCHSCIQADSASNPDIITVTHEKPNTISVDEIRAICDDVVIKPYVGPYKIYIFPDGEKMNIQAQNALLKTLEEPPSYVVMLILTDNLDVFLPTILSRCVVLPMKPAPDEDIKHFLMKEYHTPDYRADLCVSFARGNVGKAILLSQNEDFERMRKQTFSLLQKISRKELHEILDLVKEIETPQDESGNAENVDKKEVISDFLDMLLFFFRDVLVYKATESDGGLIFAGDLSYIRDTAEKCTFEGLNSIVELISKTRRRIQVNVNPDIAVEMLMIGIKDNMK
ncbi:DNA polymerase-3 subunit delta' [Butyrivibrio fibrisolvens DSM 3071]|uniref:DNA polymerase III subunit delta' n=2 Tax=Butyrivibrio fibrisolvens TaxID=831 RepID=A0A1M6AE48_BUTFI|nr:DNA polymerase III subunit delta' C-terminal domain-containing protein [Butyrivibrio fibrisolvens]SHI34687.1 DNA polymerase-3 subunit delta' [Butyrivibrio fibrisolvens DSM 3071]